MIANPAKGRKLSEHVPCPRTYQNKRSYAVHDFVAEQFSPSSTGRAEKLPVRDRKELRQGRRVASQSTRPPSPVIHVRRYEKASWLTSAGVNRKRRMIERKGLPCMKNWRFITLTVDRDKFPDPLAAYLHGCDHMRRFLEACRKNKLWKSTVKWAWKLEFHSDELGFPHWHLVVSHRLKLTHKQLAKIGELWGMGRAKTQRIEESSFGYGFKYAMKQALRESEHGEDDDFERLAPDWFLDYCGKKTVRVKVTDDSGEVVETFEAEKPVTFRRVRFWQTSKGFYTGRKVPSKPAKKQKTWGVPVTVRDALQTDSRTVQVIARRSSGQYEAAMCVVLSTPLEKFWGLVGFDTMNAGAVGLGIYSFVVPTHRLTTDQKTKWQLIPLIQQNRLTLLQAAKLQDRGETLRNC